MKGRIEEVPGEKALRGRVKRSGGARSLSGTQRGSHAGNLCG